MKRWYPLLFAGLLTVLNALKPVVVDDTAYLLFAHQIAQHPLDPYGFELFWYETLEPAMTILAPPVVPYWLAAGIAQFGEQLTILKLWLFPFSVMLAYSASFLASHLIGSRQPAIVAILVLGPGVLPFFNFMLDIPAMALQLAAVAVFILACDRKQKLGFCCLAGLLMGFALQTKYSVLFLPAVVLWLSIVRQQLLWGLVAVSVGGILFASWDFWLYLQYGQSHFLFHLHRKSPPVPAGWFDGMLEYLREKSILILPLFAHLGLTLFWLWPLIGSQIVSRRWLACVVVLQVMGFLVVCWLPARVSSLNPPRHDLNFAGIYWPIVGLCTAFAVMLVVWRLLFRVRTFKFRHLSWKTRFLLGWLVLELIGYLAITPFPAGRRVLGVSVVMALIGLRYWVRAKRRYCTATQGVWIIWGGIVFSSSVFAIDVWDAFPEVFMPKQIAKFTRDQGWQGQGYFVGHWGFQYFASREGMKLVDPGKTEFKAGDWLLLPGDPIGDGFFRPYHGEAIVEPDMRFLQLEMTFIWDDSLVAQTIPNLYGGRIPIQSRAHPRMLVGVYRVTRYWVPPRLPSRMAP